MNDLEGHSRSLELLLFEIPNFTSYYCSVVTMTPSFIVSEILPRLQCTSLPVTSRSPLLSKRQLTARDTPVSDSCV